MLYRNYKAQGGDDFEAYFVVTENNGFGRPNAAFCSTIRSQYNLTMPVLFDAQGDFVRTFGIAANHFHFVFGPENEILFRRQYDDQGWRPVVEAALSR